MASRSLSTSSSSLSSYAARIKSPNPHQARASLHLQQLRQQPPFTAVSYNPLRVPLMTNKVRGFGAVCYSPPIAPGNLRCIAAISTAVLMLAKGTAIHKSFLAPLFALQAPAIIISWMKSEHGKRAAFLALIVRLFFFIPGLELPFLTFLLVIMAPQKILKLRGTQEGVVLSLAIAAYLAFQHFYRAGSLAKSFDQGSVLATTATICIVLVPCFLLI